MGTPSFRFLCRIAARGEGAPVRGPFGGPRPTRPSGLRADTLPTLCGGGAAARPVQPPAGSGRGNVAAKAAPAARPGQVGRLRCSGAPFRKARPSPCGAAFSGPCFAPPPRRLRRRCSGAARPPQSGGCGAVRASGPVGGADGQPRQPGHACGAGRAARLCLRTRRPA